MSDIPLIRTLRNLDEASLEMTGGKAANLGRVASAGFDVPEGFVVTVEAYSRFVSENSLADVLHQHLSGVDHLDPTSIDNASEAMRRLVEQAKLSDTLIEEIRKEYRNIGSPPVAIRSSATAEDLPDASFAGQYDTSLNIEGEEDVLEHILRCFSSMWTSRAIAYREENDIPHEQVRIAVVVQQMVNAKSAGVMFTRNPVSENENELMIESNFGLGESVVAGYGIPDRFIVASRDNEFHLVSREIGTKDIIIEEKEAGSGIKRVEATFEMSQKSSLEDSEVIQLAKIGKQIETVFKSPQDIEWAVDSDGKIHVLQSRPITTGLSKDKTDNILWTRGYADDYWNDPVTPLFFSLLGDQITYIVNIEANAIMGYKGLPNELLKLYKGHAYFNLDVIRTKVINEMPPFIRSDDVLNYFPEGRGAYGKDTMRELPFALKNRLMAEIRVMLLDGDGGMTKTNEVYMKWTSEVFNPACQTFDLKFNELREDATISEILEIADELDITMMKHFRMVRYGLPVHTLGMNLILNYLLNRWLGEKAAVAFYPVLVSGLDHKTSETNRRINGLASVIREDKELAERVISASSKEILATLKASGSEKALQFLDMFDDFLDDFGDRGFTREPYYPRWWEAPEYVFDVLKSLVSESHTTSLELNEKKLAAMRKKAEKIAEDHIRGQRYGPIKWMLFSMILNMARTYIGFRENQRFNLDRWITRERKAYLEIGKRLQELEIAREKADVFFLFRDEIRRIGQGTSKLSKEELGVLIHERREEFLRYENVTPPKFLHAGREYDDPMPESSEGIIGMPASQGRVTSHVRVLNSVEEVAEVRAGEILVVPRTDPGWTPVFSKIGGLITETGGLLSHGAVVSREFGIPAVTNIRNACSLFRTGQKVTLDGNQGLIIQHDEE